MRSLFAGAEGYPGRMCEPPSSLCNGLRPQQIRWHETGPNDTRKETPDREDTQA